jgi:hypothetical protein
VSLGELVDGLLASRRLARGIPSGRVFASWEELMGERLAAVSAPLRLDHGTLVVAVDSGPWGAQVRFLAEEVAGKANRMAGQELVRRVQVVVDPAAVARAVGARGSGPPSGREPTPEEA